MAEDGISVSKDILFERGQSSGCRHAQFPVDLLERLALRFQPEEMIDHAGHQEPAAEIEKRGRKLRQRHVGFR